MFKKKRIWWSPVSFKKLLNIRKNYNQTKKKSSFWIIISIVWVIIISLIWIWITKQVWSIKFDLTTIMWIAWFDWNFLNTNEENNLLKSPDWKTNFLIIWRGWEQNDAPQLTDSIILVSLNHEKKMISLFSVPRDLYVEYPTWWAWKINETYFRWLRKYWDEFEWINQLKAVLKKITWEDIHYFVNLDFDWFVKIIDFFGWIDIDVPEDIVDTTYPGPNHTYQTFKIKAWLQTLDWATSLKYARSRHSTSDFDRSLRQQLIVKWLKEKVLNLWFLASPSKIKSVYSIFKDHVVTDLNLSQIITLALYLKDLPQDSIVSSNLNDSCFYWSSVCEKWWFLYLPLRADFWWASVLLQNGWTKANPSNYDSLVMYTNLVFNYPDIYKENLKINIFNATKVPWLANDVANDLIKYWFNIPAKDSVWNTWWEVFEKSVIYYTWDVKPSTVEALELFIFWWSQKVDILPKYSKDPENKIEIIIWNDYKNLNF